MERRSMMSLLIGVTLFVSIWHIMLQQQQQEQYYDASMPSSMNIILPSSEATSSSSSSSSLSLMNESAFSNFMYASISPDTATTLSLSRSNVNSIVISNNVLPKNDFSQLIDLDNFKFLMNPKTCKDLEQQPLIVILVHSAPDNNHKRQTIRETWGIQNDSRSLLLFLIGNVNTPTLEEKIHLENQVYGDIVQGNFNDAYRNMTYKHVMALKWFIYYCPNAHYLLKTDDDVFVNSPLLYNILERPTKEHARLHHRRLIYCHEIERAKVKRTFRSKWRVSYDEYQDKYFPNHCPGFVILYSRDTVTLLYREAQKLKYFWVDDVHITGTVASKLNISITNFDKMYLSPKQHQKLINSEINSSSSNNNNNNYSNNNNDDFSMTMLMTEEPLTEATTHSMFFFSQPNLTEMEIRKLWKLVRKSTANKNNNDNSTSMSVTSTKYKNANDNEVAGNNDDNTILN